MTARAESESEAESESVDVRLWCEAYPALDPTVEAGRHRVRWAKRTRLWAERAIRNKWKFVRTTLFALTSCGRLVVRVRCSGGIHRVVVTARGAIYAPDHTDTDTVLASLSGQSGSCVACAMWIRGPKGQEASTWMRNRRVLAVALATSYTRSCRAGRRLVVGASKWSPEWWAWVEQDPTPRGAAPSTGRLPVDVVRQIDTVLQELADRGGRLPWICGVPHHRVHDVRPRELPCPPGSQSDLLVGRFENSRVRRYTCHLCGHGVATESSRYGATLHSARAIVEHLRLHGVTARVE